MKQSKLDMNVRNWLKKIEHKNCFKRPFSEWVQEKGRKNWQNYLCAPVPVASNTVRSWPTEIPGESSSYYSVAYQTKGGGGHYASTISVYPDIGVMSTNHFDQKSKNVAQKIWLE